MLGISNNITLTHIINEMTNLFQNIDYPTTFLPTPIINTPHITILYTSTPAQTDKNGAPTTLDTLDYKPSTTILGKKYMALTVENPHQISNALTTFLTIVLMWVPMNFISSFTAISTH